MMSAADAAPTRPAATGLVVVHKPPATPGDDDMEGVQPDDDLDGDIDI